MSQISGKAFDSSLLKRILNFTKPYKKYFIVSIILTILIAIFSPLRPLLTQYALDNFVSIGDTFSLMQVTILMVILLIIQSFIQYFHSWYTNKLGQLVIRDMRTSLFDKMMSFKLSYFDKTPIGTTVTRSVSDMETIADIFSEGLIIIIGDLLQLTVIISVMFFIDWRLALISLSTIPLLLIATSIFKNKIKKSFEDVRTYVSSLNTFVQEHLTGMRIVQIFNRENEEYKRFEKINAEHRDANIQSVWYYSIFFPVVEILSAISIGLIVWWGAGAVIKEEVSFGSLVAFIMYINMLFRPIRELADKFNTLQMGMVSAERIFKVFDEKAITPKGNGITKQKLNGDIEFKNVWFTYNLNQKNESETEWILKGISFKVNAGETIAFVGATGAGKSTIIGLLNKFYEHQKGEILIDGVSILDFDTENLRKNIALVLQDIFLFSDSIKNNITLNNADISIDEIKKAAFKVGAANFIDDLPGKYDFIVQERGNSLSTGQRQLISFIRAFVHNPSILILDEATSSVDSETEELITQATSAITANRTSIVIAHRLATIQNADRIIVLDHGQIIEQGSHQQLITKNGIYKELFEVQFKLVTS